MKISIPTLLLSTAASILIFTTLSFIIVWLGFPAEKPQDSFKDALNFSGGIFAGSTTFGAAVIAAHLFNEWTDEQLGVTKSQISRELLEALVKLTADADAYYYKAVHYANIYAEQNDKDLSKEYIFETIMEAKNSHQMKAEYNTKLDSNLVFFFEKIKLYETVFDVTLLSNEDKEYNFSVYFYVINAFLSSIIVGDEVKIEFLRNALANLQLKFKSNYYDKLIEVCKKNITFSDR